MPTNITKQNIGEFTVTGEFDIAASIKADKDSSESKQVTLRFKLVNTPVGEILGSSLKDKRINWQVKGRNGFNSIKDKSVIVVDYKGGRQPVDVEQAYEAKFLSMTPAEREAKIKELQAKAAGK